MFTYIRKRISKIIVGAIFIITLAFVMLSGSFQAKEEQRLDEKLTASELLAMKDGEYAVNLDISGGSGKASVASPTILIKENDAFSIVMQWSSSNYDYMIVDGRKYLNENEDGYSTFTVPVLGFDEIYEVTADTLAMGTPHEIIYEVIVYSDTIADKGSLPQEAAKRVLIMAAVIIVGGGILNYFINKRKRV